MNRKALKDLDALLGSRRVARAKAEFAGDVEGDFLAVSGSACATMR